MTIRFFYKNANVQTVFFNGTYPSDDLYRDILNRKTPFEITANWDRYTVELSKGNDPPDSFLTE